MGKLCKWKGYWDARHTAKGEVAKEKAHTEFDVRLNTNEEEKDYY